MTATFDTKLRTRWERALRRYKKLERAFDDLGAIDPMSKEAAEAFLKMDDACDRLLLLHAPDLAAVIDKLMIIAGPGLFNTIDPGSMFDRRVIGDLRRIEFQLVGGGTAEEWLTGPADDPTSG